MQNDDIVDAVRSIAEMMGKVGGPKFKAAANAVKVAAPVVAVAAKTAPAVAQAVKPAAAKAGHAVAGVAGNAKEKLTEAVGDGVERAKKKARDGAEAKRQSTLRDAAREQLLQCAPVCIDASSIELAEKASDGPAQKFAHFPGCYAAVTYGHKLKEGKLAAYREARVFYADDMGGSILADIAGEGDVDVYADVKYKQDVRFYLYPCNEEDSRELLPSLSEVLGVGDSASDDGGERSDG